MGDAGVDWKQRACEYFDTLQELEKKCQEHQIARETADERSRDLYAEKQRAVDTNNHKDRQIRDLQLEKASLQRDVEQLCQGLKPGDSGWSAKAGPEVEEQIAYMERRLTQNSKDAIEAKKQLMDEKLAMSKATREWQEDWTKRLKQHHFEAVAHSDDLDRHRTQNEESSAELSTLRERVAELEGELAKERADYKELKKEAGTTLRFLKKERNLTRQLKDEKAAIETESKEVATKLSEAQTAAMESQQSDREQMLEAKIEDLEGQLNSEAQMSELWRDKHDKAVQERAYAVDLLNEGGEGASGSGTLQQLLSAQRQVEELKVQIEQLQSAAPTSGVRPREPEPEPAPAAQGDDDPASLARAAQQARRTRLEPQSGNVTASGQEPATSGSGGSVEDALLSAQELRLRLSETDPRKLRQKIPADVQKTVADDEIVELSQRRVDAVIQQIIRVQMGDAGPDGNDDGAAGSAIRREDMSLPGVESYVHSLWIELLQVLQDNADLRKNNLILHHERQQQVSHREQELLESLEPQGQRDAGSLPGNGAAGVTRSDADVAVAPSGGNTAQLSRAQSAPALPRTRTTPSQYGSGMTGYVRRCYAECQDQSAMKVALTAELGRLTASGEISTMTDEQWAMRPLPKE